MAKAIGCLSGGLDSTLAVALIQRLGIEVVAFHVLHLWHALPLVPGAKPRAVRAAEDLGCRCVTVDATEADLELVQHPKFGLGKRMNPCIDCRIWSLLRARELMEAEGAAFVFTGEVLGQRPMSQNRGAMNLIEREAGLTDMLLRPLSAQLLPPIKAERDGIIDRAKLLAFRGRTRKPQMALAAEFGITDYPSPAGGCLVTDPAFAFRLKELLTHGKPRVADVELLKVGRHFRLDDGTLLVMGRSAEDCQLLDRLFEPGDVRIEAASLPGPTTLLRGTPSDENIGAAAALTLRYIKKLSQNCGTPALGRANCRESAQPRAAVPHNSPPGVRVALKVAPVGGEARTIEAVAADDAEARRWIISPEK